MDTDLHIADGSEKEWHFFRNHPTYGRDWSLLGMLGTENLAKQLNSLLMNHTRQCLPDLKTRIANMTHNVQLKLEDLGMSGVGADCESDLSSRAVLSGQLLRLLSKFTTNFLSEIGGRRTEAEIWGDIIAGFNSCNKGSTPEAGESYPSFRARVLVAHDKLLDNTGIGPSPAGIGICET